MSWQFHLITTKSVAVKENMAAITALETIAVPKLKASFLQANIQLQVTKPTNVCSLREEPWTDIYLAFEDKSPF